MLKIVLMNNYVYEVEPEDEKLIKKPPEAPVTWVRVKPATDQLSTHELGGERVLLAGILAWQEVPDPPEPEAEPE